MDSFHEGDLLCARLADWAVTPKGVTIRGHRVKGGGGGDFWDLTLETMGWVRLLESQVVLGSTTADKWAPLFGKLKEAVLLTSFKANDYGDITHLQEMELLALDGLVGSVKGGWTFNGSEVQEHLEGLRVAVEDVRTLVGGADFLGVDVREYLLQLVEQLMQAIDGVACVGVEAVSIAISQLFFGMCGALECCPEQEADSFKESLGVFYQRSKYFALWTFKGAVAGVVGNATYDVVKAIGGAL